MVGVWSNVFVEPPEMGKAIAVAFVLFPIASKFTVSFLALKPWRMPQIQADVYIPD